MKTLLKHLSAILCFSLLLHGGFLAAQGNPFQAPAASEKKGSKLRIICFGAHPDDAEIRAGGSALLWGAQGHETALVSTTNGDIGHWREAGGPLAKRRTIEAQQAAKILGATSFVWDIHDGELEVNLENRRRFTRAIRQWEADIVIGHRPNDYHPDHRYTGVLMQDSAFMVGVPHWCPDVEALKKMPVYLYSYDSFQNPPFRIDIAVSIDDVIEKKIDALMVMESQFVEGGALGHLDPRTASANPKMKDELRASARESFRRRHANIADAARAKLIELYGQEVGSKVKYAEAFEVCEYGRPAGKDKQSLSPEEIQVLFPFIVKK
jgi:LmbE family N-acetylglucosaminyl deacetylase